MSQAKLCPFCRGLNSASERRCYRCGRPLPGPLASGLIGAFKNALAADSVMTRLFVGLCLVDFALCFASEHRLPLWSAQQFALSTMLRFGAIWGTLARAQPWRYFSAIFAHFNLLHLGMNCWVLVAVGAVAERELGKARFVLLFVLSGALGFVASDLWGITAPTAGASGAVFGLFGAVAVVMLRLKSRNTSIFGVIALNLVITFLVPNISWQGHLGGLVVGAGIALVYAYAPTKNRVPVTVAGVGAIAVLLVVVTVLRYALA